MIQKLRSFAPTSREKGFSLMEMLIVVLILGILATVAVFLYRGAQQNADEAAIKTGLLQASSLIEQEKEDLDGTYPRYVPNEVTQNELWSKFAYTYSDDRLVYCLAARQPNQDDPTNLDKDTVWYVGSASKEPSHEDCTQNNIGTNSPFPWGDIIPPQAPPSSFVMSWPIGANSARADLTWASNTCASGATISYNIRLTDTDESKVFDDTGVTGTNITYSNLPGFLPEDQVNAQIKTVCTKTFGGKDYPTESQYTDPVTKYIPKLPVPDTSFTTGPAAFLCKGTEAGDTTTGSPASTLCPSNAVSASQFAMYAQGTMAPVTCPIGINKFQMVAQQAGKPVMASTMAIQPTQNWQLSNFTGDTGTTYTGTAYCTITRSSGSGVVGRTAGDHFNYPSRSVSYTEYSPVGWPTAVSQIGTTSAYSGTGTTPNGLTWAATSCTFGGTPQYLPVHDDANSASPDTFTYQGTTGYGPITWAQATIYGYHIVDKCATSHNNGGTTVQSKEVTGPTYQFATDISVPTPTFNTTPAAYFKSGTNMYVQGSLNTISCVNGATPAYSLTAVQGGNTASSVMNPSSSAFDLSLPGFAPDTAIQYYGYAYCIVKQPAGQADKPYTSAPAIASEFTPVAAPGASTTTQSVTGDPDVVWNQLNASGVSCPAGGSLQYTFRQISPATGSTPWGTATTFNGTFSGSNLNMNSLTSGTSYTFDVQTRCVGTNRTSPTTDGPNLTYTAQYNKAATPSTPGSINVNSYSSNWGNNSYPALNPDGDDTVSWSGVSCNRGATPHYVLIQNYFNGNNYPGGYNSVDTTATSYNANGWIDGNAQGLSYDWAVKAYCQNAYTSGSSGWRDFASDRTGSQAGVVLGVRQPGGTNAGNDGQRTVSWGGVGCAANTTAQYRVDWQQLNGSWADRYTGWQTGTSFYYDQVGVGQQQAFVQTRCVSNFNNGKDSYISNGNATSWTVSGPSVTGSTITNPPDTRSNPNSSIYFNGGSGGLTGCGISGQPGGMNVYQSGSSCVVYGTPNRDGNFYIVVTGYNNFSNASYGYNTGNIANWLQEIHPYDTSGWQGGANLNYNGALTYVTSPSYSGGSMKWVGAKAASYTQQGCPNVGATRYGLCSYATQYLNSMYPGVRYNVSSWMSATTSTGTTSGSAGCGSAASSGSTKPYISCFLIGTSSDGWTGIRQNSSTGTWYNMTAGVTADGSGNGSISFAADNQSTTGEHEWEVSAVTVTR